MWLLFILFLEFLVELVVCLYDIIVLVKGSVVFECEVFLFGVKF